MDIIRTGVDPKVDVKIHLKCRNCSTIVAIRETELKTLNRGYIYDAQFVNCPICKREIYSNELA